MVGRNRKERCRDLLKELKLLTGPSLYMKHLKILSEGGGVSKIFIIIAIDRNKDSRFFLKFIEKFSERKPTLMKHTFSKLNSYQQAETNYPNFFLPSIGSLL